MKITFEQPKEMVLTPEKVIVRPKRSKLVSEIKIVSMTDFPVQKKVIVNTIELGKIELWTGDEYDQIGQWTDNDVKEAIISKFLVTENENADEEGEVLGDDVN
jgi:hypothetical protein